MAAKSIDMRMLEKLSEALGQSVDVQKIVIEVGMDGVPKAYVQRVMFTDTSDKVLKVVQDSLGLRVEADPSIEVVTLSEAK